MNKFRKVICLFIVVASLLCIWTLPANALSADGNFDFSAMDSLDIYDTYEKQIRADGLEYVQYTRRNTTVSPNPVNFYRYGSFLRSADEKQYFAIFNLTGNSSKVDMSENVLTIYADPEVQFKMVDVDGIPVADSSGKSDSSKVNYYKKSTDNGHSVYYIELEPCEAGRSTQMIEFTTTSTTTQPHYSIWFGEPLGLKKTVTLGTVSLSATRPSRVTNTYSLPTYGVPKRSWVSNLTVTKTSEVNASNVSRTSELTVLFPGESKTYVTSTIGSGSYSRPGYVNSATAELASGTYKVSIKNIDWNVMAPSNASYRYLGQVKLEYIYAFGA